MADIIIITYTYNRPLLLQRTIESVLSQSFYDIEHVIIANGSGEETQALLKKYCLKDKRINVVESERNVNGANKFNLSRNAIVKSNAAFYMYIDDDDYMEPDTVETLHDLITIHNADIATVGSKYSFSDGTVTDKYVFDGIYTFSRIEAMAELLKREKINSAQGGKIYRRSLLDNVTIPPVKHYRDIHREYRVVNNIEKMVVTGMPKYYFYRHDSNTSGLSTAEQITPSRLREHLEANDIRTKWLTEHMPEIKDFVFYCELSFMISLWDRIKRLNVQPCFIIADEMKDVLLENMSFLSEHDYCTDKERNILQTIQETGI